MFLSQSYLGSIFCRSLASSLCSSLRRDGWTCERRTTSVMSQRKNNLCILRCYWKCDFCMKTQLSQWEEIISDVGEMDGVGLLATASGRTPTKLVANSGCLLCGCEDSNSWKRTSLHRKVTELKERICNVLDIPLSDIESNRFICNDHCYRDVKQLAKLGQDAKALYLSLKEKFGYSNRIKRGVPSDASISPCSAAPLKTLGPATKPDSRVSKSLNFGRKEELLLLPCPVVIPPAPQAPMVLSVIQKPLVENVISMVNAREIFEKFR